MKHNIRRPRIKVAARDERTVDGITFASKAEANRYRDLMILRRSGHVEIFLRQVPFHLPGNTKYTCDFLVFWADGTVTVEDVKGMRTPAYIRSKKQVEAIYPIKIKELAA